jgi:hypothetical protein
MKRLLLTLAAATAIGGLAACETATPYQPATVGAAHAAGYAEQKLNDDLWRVTFSGNDLTSRETVERYLLYRAAELTVAQGFDWFRANDRHVDKKTSLDVDPFYAGGFGYDYGWGWRPAWRYRGSFGWRSYDPWGGGPFWADRYSVNEIQQYDASVEVRMGHGAKPDGAIDARQVLANLGPAIVRPTPGK